MSLIHNLPPQEETIIDEIEEQQKLIEVATDLGEAVGHLLGVDSEDEPLVFQIDITLTYDPPRDDDDEDNGDGQKDDEG